MSGPFLEAVQRRRTWYTLNKSLVVSEDKIRDIVQSALQSVPTSFNSQSSRAVLLFGEEHDKAWDIVTDVLKSRVSEEKWALTDKKIAGYKAAAGTVLFFIDTSVVENYATNIPTYAASFPVWAAQADAMLQFTIWSALSAEGLGANLQHYNPLIDAKIADAWDLPSSWQLSAQLVFGGRVGDEPAPKDRKPIQEKLKVYGAKRVPKAL